MIRSLISILATTMGNSIDSFEKGMKLHEEHAMEKILYSFHTHAPRYDNLGRYLWKLDWEGGKVSLMHNQKAKSQYPRQASKMLSRSTHVGDDTSSVNRGLKGG